MTIHTEDFPGPFQSIDEDGHFVNVNEAWLSTLGYQRDEIIAKPFSDYLNPDEMSHFQNNFERLKKSGNAKDIQFSLRHKLGHYLMCTFNAKIITDENGKKFTQSIFYDRTSDNKTQNIYKKLFDYSSNAIAIYNPHDNGNNFIFENVNKQFESIEGKSKNELIGKKLTDVFVDIHNTPIFEAFKNAHHTGEIQSVNTVLYDDDVQKAHKSHIIIKLPTDQLLMIYNDETQIEFSKQMLQSTVDTINSIIFTTIAGEGLDWCNKYTLDLFGYKNVQDFTQKYKCLCELFKKEDGYLSKKEDNQSWIYHALAMQDKEIVKVKIFINKIPRIYSLRCQKIKFELKERFLFVLNDITQTQNSLNSLKIQSKKLKNNRKKIKSNFESILSSFVKILEEKDSYTAGHSKRVAEYSKEIAKKMGCTAKQTESIYHAGYLHDIGKILTPESILLKPGTFNDDEYALMQQHPLSGYTILNNLYGYKKIANIIKHHHEKYDGTGYPEQLRGEEIPLFSRIMIIADSFDAMTTNRVYKPRMSINEAIINIQKDSGTHFDPHILPHAIEYFSSLKSISTDCSIAIDEISRHRFAYFFKDSLTSAYNKNYLDIILVENLSQNKYLECYIMDIHNFHQYNKKYSWENGDILLKNIFNNLSQIFNTKMIFRVHGDKFVILLNATNNCDIILPEFPDQVYATLRIVNLIEEKIDSYKKLLNLL